MKAQQLSTALLLTFSPLLLSWLNRYRTRTRRNTDARNDTDIDRTYSSKEAAPTDFMHFSKTYAQILEGLPPGLRDNAIQYRQLKKIINQVVSELSSLGLSPELLQELIVPNGSAQDPSSPPVSPPTSPDSQADFSSLSSHGSIPEADHTSSTITLGQLDLLAAAEAASHPFRLADLDPLLFNQTRVKYEVVEHSDRLEPHLRLWVTLPDAPSVPTPPAEPSFEEVEDLAPDSKLESDPARNLLSGLQSQLERVDDASIVSSDSEISIPSTKHHSPLCGGRTHEVIIPLVSDTKFFNNLSTALESMSSHLSIVHHDFLKSLGDLSRTISQTALPSSASPSFSPHSALTSHAGSIQVTNSQPSKSDLYSWREIFQLYVESEVFEHIGEYHRKERSLEESEERLKLFVEQATKRGLADRRNFKLKQSRVALQQFIEMNLFILNIKKFSEASSEATRKILKKHTKRTSLPLPSPFSSPTNTTSAPTSTALTTTTESSPLLLFSKFSTTSLPRMFVQAIGETLIPIIPHLDDYACLICTAIAFKPIRLSCGHLFCVRCLVKMQKRNKGDCPMCRAPVVLSANGSNVDWALLNFMQDWFPVEAREKLKANEREASEEELRELGIDPNKACVIM